MRNDEKFKNDLKGYFYPHLKQDAGTDEEDIRIKSFVSYLTDTLHLLIKTNGTHYATINSLFKYLIINHNADTILLAFEKYNHGIITQFEFDKNKIEEFFDSQSV